tara:strand:- start:8254 stop:8868 length:615 start_codon:yes stop_codon:yes gene_type:complete
MDNAVTLVQAYLRLNGYFTITEFPIVEAIKHGGHRTATDIDVMAVRFPGAGRLVTQSGKRSHHDRIITGVDPALGVSLGDADMIIGEVKEGKAQINSGGRDPSVLRTALVRFGCCHDEKVSEMVHFLIQKGHAQTQHGHNIRLVAFGSILPESNPGYLTIGLGHIIDFIKAYLQDNWDVFRVTDLKDPALGFLSTMIKSSRISS